MTKSALFRIADSFTKALGKLNAREQAAAKITVFDLQQNPAASGLRFHPVAGSKDQRFRSVRVNRDIRVIAHKTEDSFLICYVDHHDAAYKWAIFLHPSQRRLVDRQFNGPARASGSAGTGKTVVALHRAAAILQKDRQARVLLTTFSLPLANALKHKLSVLTGNGNPNMTILPFEGVATELYTLAFGRTPRVANEARVNRTLETAANELENTALTIQFLASEWRNVIDAWQIDSLETYQNVPRTGRRSRISSGQRERAWPVFARTRELLTGQGLHTQPEIYGEVTAYFATQEHKPFTHIIVDEAQDLGVPELRLFAAMKADNPDALFFSGDIGQRIFQRPFSWKALGVEIRGRSDTLKVNYRTSHQIRRAADRLQADIIRDVDGNEEDRRNVISVFNGLEPEVKTLDDAGQETEEVTAWIRKIIEDGINPEEIGIFVRSNNELPRAREVVKLAGQTSLELSNRVEDRGGRISIGAMHLAKGLEFQAVVVMACDDDILPSQARIDTVADEDELDEVYETERRLFYVACTRARDRLLISGIKPVSEFFEDFLEGG